MYVYLIHDDITLLYQKEYMRYGGSSIWSPFTCSTKHLGFSKKPSSIFLSAGTSTIIWLVVAIGRIRSWNNTWKMTGRLETLWKKTLPHQPWGGYRSSWTHHLLFCLHRNTINWLHGKKATSAPCSLQQSAIWLGGVFPWKPGWNFHFHQAWYLQLGIC